MESSASQKVAPCYHSDGFEATREAPSSAGESDEGETPTLVEILEDSVLIDVQKHMKFVRHPSCGAIATFFGTTRSTFAGKSVLHLIYEAYTPMALKQMSSIADAARSRWPIRCISISHRLGVVAVGEESIFIAVSSIHRDAALSAVRFIIDEIKASVPIWKKEVLVDGEVWKENSEFFAFRDKSLEFEHDGRGVLENNPKRRVCACNFKERIDHRRLADGSSSSEEQCHQRVGSKTDLA